MESEGNRKVEGEGFDGKMNDTRTRRVAFADAKLLDAFNKLKSGKFEDKQLALEIEAAIDYLWKNPSVGIKIARRLWPSEYVTVYGIDNLRKYDMRSGWRLLYTISGNSVEVVAILLEWLNHKNYERRFKYKSN